MDNTLVMVFSIFRHGDRGPLIFLRDDEFREKWDNLTAELTNKGKQQAVKLGKWYRHNYNAFLPEDYSRHHMYVYSTDTDRTLMTAECVLGGMFPPKPQKWHRDYNWHPMPIHSNSKEHDPLYPSLDGLNIDTLPDELYRHAESRTSPDGKAKEDLLKYNRFLEKKSMWEYWHKHYYGPNARFWMSEVILTGDNIKTAVENEEIPKNLPSNIDVKEFGEFVEETAQLAVETLPFYKKMGYSLLKKIFDAMEDHISGVKATKIYLYSLHDVSIFALLGLLNLSRGRTKYCGCLTFELHKLSKSQYGVKLKHKMKYDSENVSVKICGEDEDYLAYLDFKSIVLGHRTIYEERT